MLSDASGNDTTRQMTAISPDAVRRMVALMIREGILPASAEITAVVEDTTPTP